MDQLDDTQDFVKRLVRWRASQAAGYSVSRGPERVPEVSELRKSLLSLGVKDLMYFDEGLDCIQYAQAPRAAIVLGWTGFIDLLQTKIGSDNFVALNAILKRSFMASIRRLVISKIAMISSNTLTMRCSWRPVASLPFTTSMSGPNSTPCVMNETTAPMFRSMRSTCESRSGFTLTLMSFCRSSYDVQINPHRRSIRLLDRHLLALDRSSLAIVQ